MSVIHCIVCHEHLTSYIIDAGDVLCKKCREYRDERNKIEAEATKVSVEDGFGSCWSKKCPECGCYTIHVVRPGKAQCSNCG